MVGPMTRRCAEAFYVDKLFIGTDGFTKETGFTGNDYMRSEAVRDMAKQASRVIVVSDSAKFHQKGVVSLMDTKRIDSVYTDQGIPADIESYLQQQGITVYKSI